ncbi:hypothetical protein KR009_007117, partial [Drosophila setifemur]
ESDEERDLTNLNWLVRNQNLMWTKTIDSNPEDIFPKSFAEIKNLGNNRTYHHNIKSEQLKRICSREKTLKTKSHLISEIKTIRSPPRRPSPTERYEIFVNKIKRDLAEYEKLATKYETDVTEKPPFNYSHIIGMAMLEKGSVTLQQICAWIESKFAFFRVRKKWNNSIRHNLSLHHCFRNRKREDKGKGGFWELGVDPKKCDRKRIRNRKLCRPEVHHTTGNQCTPATRPINKSILTIDKQLKNDKDESMDECKARFINMSYLNTLKKKSEHMNLKSSSLTLADDFLPIDPTVQEKEFHFDILNSLGKKEISQKEYKLGKIIISGAEISDEAKELNCIIFDKIGSAPTILNEDDLLKFNDISEYSNITPVLASTSATVEVQEEENIISGISSPCNITINYDYTNMNCIDEPFHFLHNSSEYILDNLLDVCVTHY